MQRKGTVHYLGSAQFAEISEKPGPAFDSAEIHHVEEVINGMKTLHRVRAPGDRYSRSIR